MTFLIIFFIGIILIIFSFALEATNSHPSTIIAITGTISLVLAVIFHNPRPTAMDVYRGKTTLEITYKDGIAIDSVVVFKK